MKLLRWLVVAVLVSVLAGACSNADDDDGDASATPSDRDGNAPGVTDDTIRVGGVASVQNPLGGPYGDAFVGAQAYFDVVNEEGGVHGREIQLVAELDDAGASSRNGSHVRALVEQENVFAVVPVATLQFSGADYLAERDIPTFGWNINAEWSAGPSLFGARGSFTCFDCAGPTLPWVAEQIDAGSVGILAYTSPQSRDCAAGQRNSFEKFGPEVVFEDSSLSFGFPISAFAADLARIRDRQPGFITTCMDANGVANVGRALRDGDLQIPMFLPNAYDHEFVEANAGVLEGSYVGALFVPFEAADASEALQQFLEQMDEIGTEPNELALWGWVSAHLFVTGLEAAGEDPTRESVVDAINAITDYTADGIIPPVDWTTAHEQIPDESCTAVLQVQGDGTLEPVFGQPGKPFVCLENDVESLPEPVFR